MAIYHCSVKTVGRGKGKSAVAAAAYRAGEKLHDEETGLTHDYTRKGGVIYSEIILCENAPAEYADRATLWNAVHKVEKATDARLAREFEVAIPNELSENEAKALVHDFAQYLADQGMCVDDSIHWKTDNHHAHILVTTRPIKENGEWGVKERKAYALDENGERIPILNADGTQKVDGRNRKQWKRELVDSTGWNSRDKVMEWRYAWQECCNAYLVDYNKEVSCRSNADRGIEAIPTIHEGYVARQIEARGGVDERCEYNREVTAINRERQLLRRLKESLEGRLATLIAQWREKVKAVHEPAQDKSTQKVYSLDEVLHLIRETEQKAAEKPQEPSRAQSKERVQEVQEVHEVQKVQEVHEVQEVQEAAESHQSVSKASEGKSQEVKTEPAAEAAESRQSFGERFREWNNARKEDKAARAAQRTAEAEERRKAAEAAEAQRKAAEEAVRQERLAALSALKERIEERWASAEKISRSWQTPEAEKALEAMRQDNGAFPVVYHDERGFNARIFQPYEWEQAKEFADKTEAEFVEWRDRGGKSMRMVEVEKKIAEMRAADDKRAKEHGRTQTISRGGGPDR